MPSPATPAQLLRHPRMEAQIESVRAWNRSHPVGTDVIYARDHGGPLYTVTRSAAQMLAGHTAVIWLDGIDRPVTLERVSVRAPAPCMVKDTTVDVNNRCLRCGAADGDECREP